MLKFSVSIDPMTMRRCRDVDGANRFLTNLAGKNPGLFAVRQKKSAKRRLKALLLGRQFSFENAAGVLSDKNLSHMKRKLLFKRIAVGLTLGLVKGLRRSLHKTENKIRKFETATVLK